ncbi:MerR family DNA-binding transcriptional regulator [Streptomyces rubiginosohelvolus]|uniref:MerR family DNA-binding transcriptional regulator n=1 Tax=Streptomyces rubiginosohelvolus TaxID=67362 RepID=UPI003F4C3138
MEREGRPVGAASGELVTIGEFARLSRLSAKALRRYDELGLLRPALVDPVNSDGLSAVVEAADLRAAVVAADDPQEAVRRLAGLAREAGGPDNVACVVADVVVEE